MAEQLSICGRFHAATSISTSTCPPCRPHRRRRPQRQRQVESAAPDRRTRSARRRPPDPRRHPPRSRPEIFVPPHERPIAMSFQEPSLRPPAGDRQCRLSAPARRPTPRPARVQLERVGAGALADLRPTRLSGGQAQRVALARALAVDARPCCSTSRSLRSTKPVAPRSALLRSLDTRRIVWVTHDPPTPATPTSSCRSETVSCARLHLDDQHRPHRRLPSRRQGRPDHRRAAASVPGSPGRLGRWRTVVVAARRAERLAELVDELDDAHAVEVDLTAPGGPEACVARSIELAGRSMSSSTTPGSRRWRRRSTSAPRTSVTRSRSTSSRLCPCPRRRPRRDHQRAPGVDHQHRLDPRRGRRRQAPGAGLRRSQRRPAQPHRELRRSGAARACA